MPTVHDHCKGNIVPPVTVRDTITCHFSTTVCKTKRESFPVEIAQFFNTQSVQICDYAIVTLCVMTYISMSLMSSIWTEDASPTSLACYSLHPPLVVRGRESRGLAENVNFIPHVDQSACDYQFHTSSY